MSAPKPKANLAAKAVQMVYEFPGNLQKGWEAERTGEFTYMIHRANGTSREVNLHEPIRTAAGDLMPNRNDHGLLTIGEWSVLIGKGINHDLHARKLGAANTYLVFDAHMKQLGKYKLGDDCNGRPIAQEAGHLLRVGDDIVPIRPKKHDITLLVFQSEREGGYVSYINFIEIGNQMNRKDGAPGIFFRPKLEGEPAQFVETHAGQKVVTAMFWLEKNEKKVTYQYRDAKTAIMATIVSKKLEESRMVAIEAGIEPEDYDEFVENEKKLEELNSMWRKEGMSLAVGPQMFKPKSLDRSLNNGPGY